MKLTETKVKNAKAGRLAVPTGIPDGNKLWRAKYSFNGKEKLMSFGRYPDVWLADAREAMHRL